LPCRPSGSLTSRRGRGGRRRPRSRGAGPWNSCRSLVATPSVGARIVAGREQAKLGDRLGGAHEGLRVSLLSGGQIGAEPDQLERRRAAVPVFDDADPHLLERRVHAETGGAEAL